MPILIISVISIVVNIWFFLKILIPNKSLEPKKIKFILKKIGLALKIENSKTFFYYFYLFIFQLAFILIITMGFTISLHLMPDSITSWIEIIGILSIMFSIYLFLFGIFVSLLKFLIHSILIVNKLISFSEEDNKKIVTQIVLGVITITILPLLLFAIMYGMAISITNFFDSFTEGFSNNDLSFIEDLFNFKHLYYSIAISYSLPSDGMIYAIQLEMNKNQLLKIIPSIQVIIQKLLDIFLLGYIATILTKFIQKLQNNDK